MIRNNTKVKIGDQVYTACSYKQERQPLPGATNQNVDVHEAIYVKGGLPKAWLKRRKTCFTIEGDKREWYIASYYPDYKAGKQLPFNPEPQFAEHHPYGPTFILCPWDVPSGEKIDSYEYKPYDRVAVKVEQV